MPENIHVKKTHFLCDTGDGIVNKQTESSSCNFTHNSKYAIVHHFHEKETVHSRAFNHQQLLGPLFSHETRKIKKERKKQTNQETLAKPQRQNSLWQLCSVSKVTLHNENVSLSQEVKLFLFAVTFLMCGDPAEIIAEDKHSELIVYVCTQTIDTRINPLPWKIKISHATCNCFMTGWLVGYCLDLNSFKILCYELTKKKIIGKLLLRPLSLLRRRWWVSLSSLAISERLKLFLNQEEYLAIGELQLPLSFTE